MRSLKPEIKKIQNMALLSKITGKFLKLSSLVLGMFLLLISPEAVNAQCPIGLPSSGQLLANFCAPAQVGVWYEYFSSSPMPQATYRVQCIWGDGNTVNVNQAVQTRVVGGVTQWYVRVELFHTFPAAGLCEYAVVLALYNSSGVQCQDSKQTQIVANWHQDDIASANGRIVLDPVQKDVCEGLPLIDWQFRDVTNFACNLRDYPLAQKPNHTSRHQQFIYGTNPVAGRGIPNLFIKVGTAQTLLRLTDANGNPVPNHDSGSDNWRKCSGLFNIKRLF